MIRLLEKLSERQLPELKKHMDYYSLPRRNDHMYATQVQVFTEYKEKYRFPNTRLSEYKKLEDREIMDYIHFTREHAVKCRGGSWRDCSERVCPWCDACGAIHDKDGCHRIDEIIDTYKTWRRFFFRWSQTLREHEWAIYRSYHEDIQWGLYTRACPCYQVLCANHNDKDTVEALKLYDGRMLELNMEKVKTILRNKN